MIAQSDFTPPPKDCSTFDLPLCVFQKETMTIAGSGGLPNAEPLMRELAKIHNLCAGLHEVLGICSNNCIMDDQYDPEDSESEPPLSDRSINAMMVMAHEVCGLISGDIGRIADWADKAVSSKRVGGK